MAAARYFTRFPYKRRNRDATHAHTYAHTHKHRPEIGRREADGAVRSVVGRCEEVEMTAREDETSEESVVSAVTPLQRAPR